MAAAAATVHVAVKPDLSAFKQASRGAVANEILAVTDSWNVPSAPSLPLSAADAGKIHRSEHLPCARCP